MADQLGRRLFVDYRNIDYMLSSLSESQRAQSLLIGRGGRRDSCSKYTNKKHVLQFIMFLLLPAIMKVLELPPSESFSSHVSTELR